MLIAILSIILGLLYFALFSFSYIDWAFLTFLCFINHWIIYRKRDELGLLKIFVPALLVASTKFAGSSPSIYGLDLFGQIYLSDIESHKILDNAKNLIGLLGVLVLVEITYRENRSKKKLENTISELQTRIEDRDQKIDEKKREYDALSAIKAPMAESFHSAMKRVAQFYLKSCDNASGNMQGKSRITIYVYSKRESEHFEKLARANSHEDMSNGRTHMKIDGIVRDIAENESKCRAHFAPDGFWDIVKKSFSSDEIEKSLKSTISIEKFPLPDDLTVLKTLSFNPMFYCGIKLTLENNVVGLILYESKRAPPNSHKAKSQLSKVMKVMQDFDQKVICVFMSNWDKYVDREKAKIEAQKMAAVESMESQTSPKFMAG